MLQKLKNFFFFFFCKHKEQNHLKKTTDIYENMRQEGLQ